MKKSVAQLFARKALVSAIVCTSIVGVVGSSNSAYAQETSAMVRGVVTDLAGSPVSGATVVVTSSNTGISKTATTDANGAYSVRGLPAGVAYDVTVDANGLQKARTEGMQLAVGQSAVMNYRLSDEEEVIVVAQRAAVAETAIGPTAIFDLQSLQDSPAINRNINDIIGQDPRIFIDQSSGVDSIQCNGANPRFNSLTVDGIRLNDGFGLNSNGYPTQRMPFPFDAISSVAVELAPMSVVYGGFSACNVNAVTKTGSNEIFGSLFFDYGSDSLRGDKLEGDTIESQSYEETRYGFEIGGAILEDNLFFYGAYEKYDGVDLNDRGAIGSGAVNEVLISQGELDRIAQIARDVYDYDPGTARAEPFDFEDEKYLAKIDWYVTDAQRVALTYMYNDSFNFTPSDGDLNEFEFSKHFYKRGAELESYTLNWYSDWSSNFSTEVRYSVSEVDFLQQAVSGPDFGEVQIRAGDGVNVYLGADDSRHANSLNWDTEQLVLRGHYTLGDHTITAGFERESIEVYNLFYQHTDTEIRFNSIDDFEAGLAQRVYYGNAISNVDTDSAVEWAYDVNTFYIEDEWQFNDRLLLTFGLRYDYYETSDVPNENPDFVADYVFSNTATLDGVDLLLPRFGFTFAATDDITLRGGVGLFSGGNPNVWYSNVYSNTNTTSVQALYRAGRGDFSDVSALALFDFDYSLCESGVPTCGPGYGVPTGLANEVASGKGSNFEIVYLDPDFEAPTEWKYALGLTWEIGDGYTLQADAQITRGDDTAIYKHGDLEKVGTNADGRPVYDSVRIPTFVLTNSSKGNESESLSVSLFKAFDFGLDMRLGYAWTDAKDVNPMTSSVAFSNYSNRTFFDPEEEVLSTSNYNVEHRFTAVLNYTAELFANYETRVSLFAQSNSGTPYSIVLPEFEGQLAYGFTPYFEGDVVLVEPGTRNNQEGSWWTKADLRITQEFPGLTAEHRGSAFIIIDNVTNLLNDDWGVMERPIFPYGVTQAQQANGQAETRVGEASLWEVRVGLNYRF